jgi:benzoate-CoA ligase
VTPLATPTQPELPPGYRQVPQRLNFTDCVVGRHLRAGDGDRPALHYEGTTFTYAQLDGHINRAGHALRCLGIDRGDRFLIRSPNSPQYAALFFAGLRLGAVPIPSNSLFRAWEIEHIIQNSQARAVFSTEALVAHVEEVAANCPSLQALVSLDGDRDGPRVTLDALMADQPSELATADTAADELAFIIYTSGTTQWPKGVEHAHRTAIANSDPVSYELMQLRPDDVCMQPQEISFIYSLICGLVSPLRAGAQAVLYPGRFESRRALEAVQRYGVTEFVGVPTIFRMLLTADGIAGIDTSSVRMGISGGEPLAEHTYHEVRHRFGFEVYDLMGQTEAWIFMSNRPGLAVKPGSLGQPLTGRDSSIRDEAGMPASDGEVGHLCLLADDPGLALGYRDQPQLWDERFADGWYYTGDLAYRDQDGYYWYVSRGDDLIKSRAYLVSPSEVEAAAVEHPAVLEAAVIGAPDDVIGQRICAYVVLKPGYAPDDSLGAEITAHIRSVIAPYKTPKEVTFMPELPKTATSKIRRAELREAASAELGQSQ